ncbi:hypothetical protein [Caballeronia calidae]|uniref:hypothetical protein n=1 Tax=Caballeronia calidae TaxID=1777139 RepID=UPI0018DFAB16|nr:hypothetical protein [Caballeronia calidae]
MFGSSAVLKARVRMRALREPAEIDAWRRKTRKTRFAGEPGRRPTRCQSTEPSILANNSGRSVRRIHQHGVSGGFALELRGFRADFGVSPRFPDACARAQFPLSARRYFASRATLLSLPAHVSRDEAAERAIHCRSA